MSIEKHTVKCKCEYCTEARLYNKINQLKIDLQLSEDKIEMQAIKISIKNLEALLKGKN